MDPCHCSGLCVCARACLLTLFQGRCGERRQTGHVSSAGGRLGRRGVEFVDWFLRMTSLHGAFGPWQLNSVVSWCQEKDFLCFVVSPWSSSKAGDNNSICLT